jgi:hypothetical protein
MNQPLQLPSTTNKSFDEHGMQFAWDATSLKVAEECPRKYYYKLICGYYRPEKSYHLLFGGWYATALEHFYKHLALGMDRESALERVVHEALVATWEYETDITEEDPARIIPGTGHPWQSPDTAKTRENLIRTIVWYVDHFNDQNIKVIRLPDGKPAVEYSFTLNVDYGYQFCGHIDRLVDFEAHPYVMDQKTTGTTLTARFYDQFSPDMQMSMYTFAGRAIYQMPVKGVIIDAAQIAVGFSRFERGFTFRSESQLEEWYADTIELIEQTREYTAEQHFPMRTTACGNYGGCEFRQVCSRSPSVRENFLAGEFKRGPTWDPLTRR